MPPSAGRPRRPRANASHIRRARSRLAAASASPVGPQATGSRASSRASGNRSRTRSRSCSTASTVRPSPCQRSTRSSRSRAVLRVDRGERLVEQDQARVLQQQPREQDALQLAARQRADHAPLEPGQPDRRQRLLDPRPLGAADAPKRPQPAPQAHRHEVADGDRERAVDLGQLRQVGDVAPRRGRRGRYGLRAGAAHPAMPLSRVDLPAPLGPTTASRAPCATSPRRWWTAGWRS